MTRPRSPEPDPTRSDPEAAEAGRATLETVNSWIRHLDAKAAVTLAADGAAAGLLYNVVRTGSRGGRWSTAVAVACAVALLVSAFAAARAVAPRLRTPGRPGAGDPNPLFFGDISRAWSEPAGYTATLSRVAHEPEVMTRHLGHQIWVNSTIARRKARHTSSALAALMIGLVLLAGLAASSVAS